jgi:membrane associated rhomboid family serine protease
MGLYDRDYERERSYYDDQRGFHLGGQLSFTAKLIIVMSVIYLVQLITEPKEPPDGAFFVDDGWFTNTFRLYPDVFRRPWLLFELLTYGFLHSVDDFSHIILNMVGLWFFGRPIEERYGRREYLMFFLAAVVFAGIVWVLGELVANQGFVPWPAMVGASGGIAAVVILFALNYPNATALFMFVIPMKMWVLAVLLVAYDAYGAMTRVGGTAFTAHLGGAAFGYLYYRWGGRFENRLPSGNPLKRLKPGPKLRVHDPEQVDADEQRMDEILKKIQDHGQDSLTRGERRFLEKESRKYQQRRR